MIIDEKGIRTDTLFYDNFRKVDDNRTKFGSLIVPNEWLNYDGGYHKIRVFFPDISEKTLSSISVINKDGNMIPYPGNAEDLQNDIRNSEYILSMKDNRRRFLYDAEYAAENKLIDHTMDRVNKILDEYDVCLQFSHDLTSKNKPFRIELKSFERDDSNPWGTVYEGKYNFKYLKGWSISSLDEIDGKLEDTIRDRFKKEDKKFHDRLDENLHMIRNIIHSNDIVNDILTSNKDFGLTEQEKEFRENARKIVKDYDKQIAKAIAEAKYKEASNNVNAKVELKSNVYEESKNDQMFPKFTFVKESVKNFMNSAMEKKLKDRKNEMIKHQAGKDNDIGRMD